MTNDDYLDKTFLSINLSLEVFVKYFKVVMLEVFLDFSTVPLGSFRIVEDLSKPSENH